MTNACFSMIFFCVAKKRIPQPKLVREINEMLSIFIQCVQYKRTSNGVAAQIENAGRFFYWKCLKVLELCQVAVLKIFLCDFLCFFSFYYTVFFYSLNKFFFFSIQCESVLQNSLYLMMDLNLYSCNSVRYNERRRGV